MPDFAVWLPGTDAKPERTGPPVFSQVRGVAWSDLNGLPGVLGGEVTYRLWHDQSTRFIFSFSTPVLTSGRRVRPDTAFVLFATTGTAQIFGLTLTDGSSTDTSAQVVNVNPFRPVSGSHPDRLEANITMFDLRPFYRPRRSPFPSDGLMFGLAMQVAVMAGTQDSEITFFSAGVDLNLV